MTQTVLEVDKSEECPSVWPKWSFCLSRVPLFCSFGQRDLALCVCVLWGSMTALLVCIHWQIWVASFFPSKPGVSEEKENPGNSLP
jgi:hypothetical protein